MIKHSEMRKSHIAKDEIYFVTSTIHKWILLLEEDEYKEILISSMEWLCNNKAWEIFGFVIMPNHIHMIVRTNSKNGKEYPNVSFLKFTAHKFQERLRKENNTRLEDFRIDAENKKYQFWKRDSLAISLYTQKIAYQKLDYIHNNPLIEKWSLANDPSDYYYSSASFYERGHSSFSFISDLRNEF
jgi:putative transposase